MDEKPNVDDIFRYDKMQKAINDVIVLLADEGLTVVESFFVIRSVTAAFKGNYPDAYKLFEDIWSRK
jgi:hypothetical protein